MLADWGEVSIEHLNEHIIPKTTGPTRLTATWEDQLGSITAGSNKIGWGSALQHGVGTLWWGIPASVPVSGGGTVPRADVLAYFNSHHEINLAVGSVVIKGVIQNGSLLSGVYYITIGESDNHATQTGGTPTDGASVVVDLDSLLATKAQIEEAALKASDETIGGKGGTAGQLWTRGSSDSNAGWEDRPISHGTSLPLNCNVPALFALTVLSGNNSKGLYVCLATDTWTNVGP